MRVLVTVSIAESKRCWLMLRGNVVEDARGLCSGLQRASRSPGYHANCLYNPDFRLGKAAGEGVGAEGKGGVGGEEGVIDGVVEGGQKIDFIFRKVYHCAYQ